MSKLLMNPEISFSSAKIRALSDGSQPSSFAIMKEHPGDTNRYKEEF